ncbi:MAG: hypothetical protein H7174_03265 [Flavobacterium sp.]|nr:hypothetical protein [Flavobacterium sp.]
MEQNKLESQIKNQLNAREIKPSAMAWDRLDAMLTIAEKPKKRFPWLLVAASFIGFVFIVTIIFRTNVISPSANEQIPEGVVNDNITNNSTLINPKITTQNEQTITQNLQPSTINLQPSTINLQPKTTKKVSIINQNQIAIINEKSNQKNELKPNEIIIQEVNINQVTENTLPETSTPIINNKIAVDANKLLSQVDSEIKMEYRESVFQKISRKYQTAKTAFVERNIQK